MPGRGFLTRFRPAGAPGGAGSVGVPAEPEDRAAAELAVVFAALAPTLQQCEQVRATARESADRLLARARAEAEASVHAAERDAAALRAGAAARVQQQSEDDARDQLARARSEAEQLLRAGRRQLPGLIDGVIARLRSDLGLAPVPGTAASEPGGQRGDPAGRGR